MQRSLKKHWQIFPSISSSLHHQLADFPPVMRQILANRGFTDSRFAADFMDARLSQLCDPLAIKDMPLAVERIERAVRGGELIAVYGDYDVDGVTATTLLVQVLRAIGGRAVEYIPNRFDEGYGLNKEALEALFAQGVSLVITVDCGIRSLDEAIFARKMGLDLIVSDHHHPLETIPDALAVINPRQRGDLYPDKDLTGVGLAYKIAQALLERLPVPGVTPEDWLDLVALGTVADLAPLLGENRVLVREGLAHIRHPHRQGLAALAAAAGMTIEKTTASDIGFILGPRLNAAGRLDSALAAYRLLTTADPFEAGQLAQQLNVQNYERRQITQQIEARAEELVLSMRPDARLIFAVDGSFNAGVVGLAASRLVETYYLPAIVATQNEEFTRGSCRSIPEFHITQALDQCADLLVRHGGHAAAAGFTVRNENLPALMDRLHRIALDQLGGRDLQPVLTADVDLPLRELTPGLMDLLEGLQPTGYGNPEPVFVTRNLKIRSARPVGNGKHLKMSVTDGWATFDAIAFRLGHLIGNLPPMIDLMYTYERNDFRDWSGFQLNVRDLKPAGTPD